MQTEVARAVAEALLARGVDFASAWFQGRAAAFGQSAAHAISSGAMVPRYEAEDVPSHLPGSSRFVPPSGHAARDRSAWRRGMAASSMYGSQRGGPYKPRLPRDRQSTMLHHGGTSLDSLQPMRRNRLKIRRPIQPDDANVANDTMPSFSSRDRDLALPRVTSAPDLLLMDPDHVGIGNSAGLAHGQGGSPALGPWRPASTGYRRDDLAKVPARTQFTILGRETLWRRQRSREGSE